MSFADLVMDNYRYFRDNILPYYNVIPTKNNRSLVIGVEPSNLQHLLGANKSTNVALRRMNGSDFYAMLEDIKDSKELPDLLNQDDVDQYEAGNDYALKGDDRHIYWKNVAFIDTFKSLVSKDDVRIYSKDPGADLDTDFAQRYNYGDNSYSYACFIGNDLNDYYSFNSVVVYSKNDKQNNSFIGRFPVCGPIELVKKKQFSASNYVFLLSKRNINRRKGTSKPFKPEWKKIGDRLSKCFISDKYRIGAGMLGKNTIQLIDKESGMVVDKHLEETLRTNFTDEELKAYRNQSFVDKVINVIKTVWTEKHD